MTFLKKITTGLLGLVLVFSLSVSVAPRPTHAVGLEAVVEVGANLFTNLITTVEQTASTIFQGEDFLKEYVLDPIAYQLANTAREAIMRSVVNWVASGFHGSPAFVTNIQNSMLRVGDTVANRFLRDLETNGAIRSPYQSQVAQVVRDNYFRVTGHGTFGNRNAYTLSQTCENDEAFLHGDFTACGLSGWRQAWLHPANNPFGASLVAEDELTRQVSVAQDDSLRELDWGRGYRPFRNCSSDSTSHESQHTEGQGDSVALSNTDPEQNCPIISLGSDIIEAFHKVGFSEIDRLVSADEISEVISALLGNLVNNLLEHGATGTSDSLARGTLGGNASTSPSLSSNFSETINGQVRRVEQYRDAWIKIRDAAQAAKDHLTTCTDQTRAGERLRTEVQPVLDNAASALARASNALLVLGDLKTRAQAATDAQAFSAITVEYQCLLSGGRITTTNGVQTCTAGANVLPGPQEIVDALTNAQDTGGAGIDTTVSKMNRITEERCRLFGN